MLMSEMNSPLWVWVWLTVESICVSVLKACPHSILGTVLFNFTFSVLENKDD